MSIPTMAAAAAVVALLPVPVTAGGPGGPYEFSDRGRVEREVSRQYARLFRLQHHRALVVHSIGCAKAGIGHVRCALVATIPPDGIQTWAIYLDCPTDTGVDCTIRSRLWPER